MKMLKLKVSGLNLVLLKHVPSALLLSNSGQINMQDAPLGVIIQIIRIGDTKQFGKSIKQLEYETILT